MKTLLLCLLLALPSAAQEPAPSEAGPAKPAAVNRDAFTFVRYNLNVRLDLPKHAFAVRGTIAVRNDSQQPQSAIALQISSSLKWAAVRAGDNSLSFTSTRIPHDIDHTGSVNEAVVDLPAAVKPGEGVELEVGYSGTIEQEPTRLQRLGMPAPLALRSDWDIISDSFSAVRGVGYVAWYPVTLAPATLDDGNKVFQELGVWRARHANSRFRITFSDDSGKSLVTNGEKKSEVEKVFEMERMGVEGPFFVVSGSSALTTANGRVIYQQGSEDAARRVGSALARLEPAAASGKPSAAVVVQLPAGWAAYESGPMLLTPFAWRNDNEMEQQLVHTITHANLYSARSWIYEGLAHMAQAAWIGQQQGRVAALAFLEERRTALTLIAPLEPGPNDASNSLINATDEIYYRSKAMWVWWMLREMLSPAVLKKAMVNYQADSDKGPSYVQRLLESASGKDLEWFFDDWVYRDRGLPDFRIVSVYPRQTLKGNYIVTVTVENLGRAGAEVPVRMRMKDGETSARLIVAARSQATIRIEIPRPPVQVLVNDGSVLEGDDTNNSFAVPPGKQ